MAAVKFKGSSAYFDALPGVHTRTDIKGNVRILGMFKPGICKECKDERTVHTKSKICVVCLDAAHYYKMLKERNNAIIPSIY